MLVELLCLSVGMHFQSSELCNKHFVRMWIDALSILLLIVLQ